MIDVRHSRVWCGGSHDVCCRAFVSDYSCAAARRQRVDLVRVDKSERRMELLAEGEVVRTYAIALGANPVGHKQQQGDERTPEGR